MRKRRHLAMRASLKFMLFAVMVIGAPNALAQDDPTAAKRKNEYGLGGTGQSPGQGLRRPDGIPDQKTEKRGNTPPGSDRAGDRPASGAITDPAGVTK
jgi:hypothetical protein